MQRGTIPATPDRAGAAIPRAFHTDAELIYELTDVTAQVAPVKTAAAILATNAVC
jgi:hypothetical protein